jgi:hypothetical protein
MKNLFKKKIWTIASILLLIAVPFVFSQTQKEQASPKEKAKSDTAQIQEKKPPSPVTEVRIDQEGISLRTQEGKELRLGKGESEGGTLIGKDKIKIGGLEIDLKPSKDLETLQIEIPSSKRSEKVYSITHDIVKTGRDIVVEEYEKVDGGVVAIGGDVTIKGTVTGDVVAVGGDVLVASTGVIEGDAVSVGGEVKKEPGARVRGTKAVVNFFPKNFFTFRVNPPLPFFGAFQGLALFARIIKIMLFLFLGIVVISIVPKNVAKVKDQIGQDFLKSALVGFAGEILILPIFLLLIVTIIGIPVAILVLPLLILATFILGYTGISYFIGEKLKENTSLKPDTPILTVVVGILVVEAILLVARVVGIFGHFFSPFSWILTFIGWMVWYVAITVGFGASILTRLGTRPKEIKLVEAPISSSNSTPSDKTSN